MRSENDGHIILAVPGTPLTNSVLSVVIPLTQMAGRMKNLDTWLSGSGSYPINIVIVHDIQDSLTAIELKALLKKHSQLDIELVEGTFGSPGLARNAGMKGSLGTWTTFWDADDLPNPQEVLAAISESDNFSEVIIGNYTVDCSIGTQSILHYKRLESVAINPGLWRMIFRSSTLKNLKFSSERMGEDQLFLIDLNLGSKVIYFSERDFYKYFKGNALQLTSNQCAINEVLGTLDGANRSINTDRKLRNTFSEIVVLRLLITALLRTKGTSKLGLVIKYSSIFFRTHPQTLISLVFVSIRKKQHDLHDA
jgi:glycosyltransferase involved in cell wall biosynthesis